MSALIEFETAQLRSDVPDFKPGDTLRVSVRIIEGDKQRVQDYQGLCIGRRGSGLKETFTVRRVSYGVGMERVFPLHSPRIEKIVVVRRGKVRRAKLLYLRELSGKKARIQEIRPTKASASKRAEEAALEKSIEDAAVQQTAEQLAAAEPQAARSETQAE